MTVGPSMRCAAAASAIVNHVINTRNKRRLSNAEAVTAASLALADLSAQCHGRRRAAANLRDLAARLDGGAVNCPQTPRIADPRPPHSQIIFSAGDISGPGGEG